MAFRGLQAESVEQGRVHKAIAQELQDLVADPFDEWAQRYKVRVFVPDCQQGFLTHCIIGKTRAEQGDCRW
jgi:hypothetical protein